MKSRIHASAGILAIALVATFMTATITVEATGNKTAILVTKTAILFALIPLVVSIVIAGGSGRSLAADRNSPLLKNKRRRTSLIAAVGALVLIPCAITLRVLAASGKFGITFAVVQAIELTGGAVNITMLILNARAGRLLTAARRRRKKAAAKSAFATISDRDAPSRN
ncbi:MAG TPA: hypothetical protein VFO01_19550 [Trebonia sp.]|nr:hypothetical protein [Trebonia sp.]